MRTMAAIFVGAVAWSVAGPGPFRLWFAESGLILAAAAILVATRRRFEFTRLTYAFFLGFAVTVLIGARYTYALAPIGEWMKYAFGFSRNHFDRVGHLAQGLAPALVFRELLIRRVAFPRGIALFLVVCGLCLGAAAMFELLEWRWAIAAPGTTEDLGAQGDRWDAQADMFMALAGAVGAQAVLARRHDREIAALANKRQPTNERSSFATASTPSN